MAKICSQATCSDKCKYENENKLNIFSKSCYLPHFSGKLPIQVDDGDDAQQVFSKVALELPQPEEEKTRKTNFNSRQDLDECAPPLPPKLLAG